LSFWSKSKAKDLHQPKANDLKLITKAKAKDWQ